LFKGLLIDAYITCTPPQAFLNCILFPLSSFSGAYGYFSDFHGFIKGSKF